MYDESSIVFPQIIVPAKPFVTNHGQSVLLDELCKWLEDGTKPIYVYSGGPGTGKTTVFKHFLDKANIDIEDVIAVAYTGHAADVLSSNGLPAGTIHSMFYAPELSRMKDEYGDYIIEDGDYKYSLQFKLREELPENIRLIFIDELSMVPDNMMKDILSFGIPVVGAGDIDQLPPVFGICSYMMRPDYFLTEIMRQEEGSPIIKMYKDVLAGIPLREGVYPGAHGESRILSSIDMGMNLLDDYDEIICCKNETCDKINNYIRKQLLNRLGDPVEGDKIVCRQNIKDRSEGGRFLTNGSIGYIDFINPSTVTANKADIDFVPVYNHKVLYPNLQLDLKYIRKDYQERAATGLTKYIKFEYGYAITCHRSQGSQYQRLLYIDEPFGSYDLRKHIRYTAISRARERIDILLTKRLVM